MSEFLTTHISPLEIVATFVFLLLIIIIILLILLILNNRKMQNLTYPVYDYIVKGAESKARRITYDAMKSSREMLRDAELAGIKVIAKDKVESKKIEEEYEKTLKDLAKQTESLLSQYMSEVEKGLKSLTSKIEKQVSEGITKNESFLQQETNKLSTQLASTFKTLEANAKEQIRNNVENELISVKKLVETYRQERYALIDSQIVSLIENTVAVVFQKKLSLADHTELMYRALEEAKSKDAFS